MSSFLILGEALIDLRVVEGAAAGGEGRPAARAYTAQPGGSPFNVAVGLARLGRRTQFAGRIAHDALGGILRRHAEQSGVSLRSAGAWPGPTPAALFDLGEDGSARYEFHLGDARTSVFSAAEAALTDSAAADAAHFGSLASWQPGSADAVLDAAGRLRRRGVFVSYDPNIRAMLIKDRAAALAYVARAASVSHLIKASAEDLGWLYPDLGPADAAERLLARGPLAVVVTHGPDGADCFSASGRVHGSSAPVAVVDTVGAGDAFMAGLLDGLAAFRALGAEAFAALLRQGSPNVADLLDAACAHAAATCARQGADPPWRETAAAA